MLSEQIKKYCSKNAFLVQDMMIMGVSIFQQDYYCITSHETSHYQSPNPSCAGARNAMEVQRTPHPFKA